MNKLGGLQLVGIFLEKTFKNFERHFDAARIGKRRRMAGSAHI